MLKITIFELKEEKQVLWDEWKARSSYKRLNLTRNDVIAIVIWMIEEESAK